ncbi:MAG: hypothetical protein JXQ65_05015 [Candidatus Marinimicrobia bacterium]|nr:hypothetical protein [Candidatus Neomarinimicrobiota bacterium]
MKQIYWMMAFLIFLDSLWGQFPSSSFEIVESIPCETILENPEIRNTQKVWLEMIGNANKTLDIEQFYISNEQGEPLEDIISAIEQRAKRGVRVRIIAENKMEKTYPETLQRLKKTSNIEVRILSAFEKLHGINHSKYFIVDNEQVFVGSQNFDWRALKHIHEIGLAIRHAEFAKTITEIFEMNWEQALSGKLTETERSGEKRTYTVNIGNERVEFFPTASPYGNMPKNFFADEQAILEALNNAQKSIKIQLLSYSPAGYDDYYGNLDNAIRQAALKNVQVEILLSDWCTGKKEIPYLKSLQVLPNVEVRLSTIPEYSGGHVSFARVEHCKMMLIDEDITWIGTSNWKKNYFYNSRNLGLIVKSNTVNQKLTEIFDKSWHSEYANAIDINKHYTQKQYGEK